jgi:GAF domain-containing protein
MMTDYNLLVQQVESLGAEEPWWVPFFANTAALLMETLPDLNWAGFYVLREGQLVLGPFTGKPACIHIPLGKGVCGTAAVGDNVLRVPDVHAFPGHIACDSQSASELVIPLHRQGRVFGVLDLDSPKRDRFTAADEAGLQRVAAALERMCTICI